MLRKTILSPTTKAGAMDTPSVKKILASSLQRLKFVIVAHYYKPKTNLKTDWSSGVCFTLENIKHIFHAIAAGRAEEDLHVISSLFKIQLKDVLSIKFQPT